MNGLLERPGTVIPSVEDAELAATASRALARASKDALHVRLGNGDELALPKAVTRLLSHLLIEMGQGSAVTVIPIHAELTTQQAADFLNVSRPHLISLLQSKEIPFHMVGSHRRVRFADVCAYKDGFEQQRRSAMTELTEQAQELGFGYQGL
jgi:excisionase family DNA binding protein